MALFRIGVAPLGVAMELNRKFIEGDEGTMNEKNQLELLSWTYRRGTDIDQMYGELRKETRLMCKDDPTLQEKISNLARRFNSKSGLLSYSNQLNQFIQMHDAFYEGAFATFVINSINGRIDGLPVRILEEMKKLFVLSTEIDRTHLILGGSLKQFIELNAERISTERKLNYPQLLSILIPNHESFFKEYLRMHLLYLTEKDNGRKESLKAELIATYHLGSEKLASRRIAKEFSKDKIDNAVGAKGLSVSINKTDYSLGEEEISTLKELITFDNYYDYLYEKNLKGLSGFALRLYLKSAMKKDSGYSYDFLLSESTEKEMVRLIENKITNRKMHFMIEGLKSYRQTTPYTCGAVSLMMVQNLLLGKPISKAEELIIYEKTSIKEYTGSHESALALIARQNGLDVRLFHETPELFTYWSIMAKDVFEKLMDFYKKNLAKAMALGVKNTIGKIGKDAIVRELEDGYIPIVSFMLNESETHMAIVTGYERRQGTIDFLLFDPLRGRVKVSESELDLNVPWGRSMMSISGFVAHEVVEKDIAETRRKLAPIVAELRT